MRFLSILHRSAVGCGLLLFVTSCAAPPAPMRGESPALHIASPEEIFAPLQGDGAVELVTLEEAGRSDLQTLRRAWILIQRRRGDEAIQVVNRMIHGIPAPPPALVAYGHYVRSAAHAQCGDRERAAFDLEQARLLAIDQALIARLDREAPRPAPPRAAAAATIQQLDRARWGARTPDRGNLDPMGRIWRVTVHHSAMLARPGAAQVSAAAIRAIQQQHMEGRGYGDIGYHFLIDPTGRIWQGRDLKFQGAHASGANNEGNVGICLLGNFTTGRDGQEPTDAQLRSLQTLLRQVCQQHRLPAREIHTHREFRPTSCPGEHLQGIVERMRAQWAAAPGGIPAATAAPETAGALAQPQALASR